MTTSLYNYQYTQYPNIFKNVYWGHFKEPIEKNIIENRNNFIKEFDIIKKKDLTKKLDNFGWEESDNDRMFDHRECYIDKNGNYILIISPYAVINQGEIRRSDIYLSLIQKGFIVYDRLYANSATTFIKKIIT